MRPTLPQLDGWRLDTLRHAADVARENADALDGSLDDCSRAVDAAGGWIGKTKEAAWQRTNEETDHGREVRNLLLRFADDADDAHRGFEHAVKYVLSQRDHAVQQGCTVAPDGTVTAPNTEKEGDAGVFQLNIMSGLDEVERIDTTFGATLRDVQAQLGAIRDGQQDVTIPGGERRDPDAVVAMLATMTPDQVATFLAGMSPADVQQLVIAAPDKIGNMNGVPFDTRIAANELNIRNALAAEERKPDRNQSRIDQLRRMLAPIPDPAKSDSRTQAIPTDGPGSAAPDNMIDRKFVMFSPDGNGRMIEMVGAMTPGVPGIGVYVPGTGTNLNGSDTNTTAAWNLAHQTKSPIFLYMEGDFPQDFGQAADKRWTQEMAPKLVHFGHEVDREVAAHAPGTPVTYVGHSYGGAIVGTAEQEGLRADRILHASSAGTGSHSGGWHDPNPNVQRYSMTAPADPIGAYQSTSQKSLGADPDTAPGVTRLDTGYYHQDGDGFRRNEPVFGPNGHGKYWNDPTSDAFQNIVGVIAGGEVTGYVDREILSNHVDAHIGDANNWGREIHDVLQGRYWANDNPYGNPHVTINPELGPRIPVR
ncbi:alpha/beta hydrolase [Nocardia sp. NPDC052566]|uniref:alpha/beta hydrolase n=1 Tax=Nocardia sp. NPDC052566 TaxID=3364330 RepID=UPI0037CC2DE2